MPKVRRSELPEALLRHLLLRVREHEIAHDQIILLAQWLDTLPEVPAGRWFKTVERANGKPRQAGHTVDPKDAESRASTASPRHRPALAL